MHYTQNDKIAQVGHDSLVIGVDVGSEKQHARAFGPMQIEYTRKAFSFNNSAEGFDQFLKWAQDMQLKKGLKKIMVGFEPTGHYWFNLADCLEEQGIEYVLVAPQHVKHTKELDDNIQQKDDNKDPRVIAKLVFGGRYLYAYRPKGIYAELRVFNGALGLRVGYRPDAEIGGGKSERHIVFGREERIEGPGIGGARRERENAFARFGIRSAGERAVVEENVALEGKDAVVVLARAVIRERFEPVPLRVKDEIALRVVVLIDEDEPRHNAVARLLDAPSFAFGGKFERSREDDARLFMNKRKLLRVLIELHGPRA